MGREVTEQLSRSELEALLDIVNSALQVHNGEDLENLWPRIADLAQLEGGIFGVSKVQSKDTGVQLDLITFGVAPDWLNEYRANQLVEQDPLVMAALQSQRPLSWKDAAKMAIEIDADAFQESRFRKQAQTSGLEYGYIYSKRSQYLSQAIAVTAVTTGSKSMTEHQCILLEILLPHLNEILIRQGFSTAPQLSARESEVLSWATAGKSNWEVARILNISERTVKFHLRNIYRKLEVANRSHAVAEALRLGVVNLE